SAKVFLPTGLATDSEDSLFIADSRNYRIRKLIAGTGVITTVAGNGCVRCLGGDGGPATSAQLAYPVGVTVGARGNLYIADANQGGLDNIGTNNRIRGVFYGSDPIPVFLNPNSATAGSAGPTLTVTGDNFVAGSTVNWNGSGLSTSFVSANQLTAV